MGSHPLNLAARFALELALLAALGRWGFGMTASWPRLLAAMGLPLAAALIWGTFATPDDPSRSGRTIVATPGPIRLALELILFALGTYALFAIDAPIVAVVFATATILHYSLSYDRIAWLFRRRADRS